MRGLRVLEGVERGVRSSLCPTSTFIRGLAASPDRRRRASPIRVYRWAPPLGGPAAPSVGDLPPVFSDALFFRCRRRLFNMRETARSSCAADPPFARARRQARVGAVRAGAAASTPNTRLFTTPGCAWSIPYAHPLRSCARSAERAWPALRANDFQVGVHKAPANARSIWAQDVTVLIDDAVHGILNTPASMRSGLAGPRHSHLRRAHREQRRLAFVNVRRLMMMIEKAIEVATQWAVFEPNANLTRIKST